MGERRGREEWRKGRREEWGKGGRDRMRKIGNREMDYMYMYNVGTIAYCMILVHMCSTGLQCGSQKLKKFMVIK